jgi:hypothetical protein
MTNHAALHDESLRPRGDWPRVDLRCRAFTTDIEMEVHFTKPSEGAGS